MSHPLFGLVLVGGQSRRMGRDKALLRFDGQRTQLERTTSLLQRICQRVFISQRKEQSFAVPAGTEVIYDAADPVKGPLCGILSAGKAYPEADWLVLACDLPNVQEATLRKLIEHFDSDKSALTAYRSSSDGLAEPLCAIYPAGITQQLEDLANQLGKHSPRDLLSASGATLVEQDAPDSLNNVNTRDEFEAVTKQQDAN
ncbi:MAG: molybdenum cofactor guanylyltransferase [Coraliomargarita sp.]